MFKYIVTQIDRTDIVEIFIHPYFSYTHEPNPSAVFFDKAIIMRTSVLYYGKLKQRTLKSSLIL